MTGIANWMDSAGPYGQSSKKLAGVMKLSLLRHDSIIIPDAHALDSRAFRDLIRKPEFMRFLETKSERRPLGIFGRGKSFRGVLESWLDRQGSENPPPLHGLTEATNGRVQKVARQWKAKEKSALPLEEFGRINKETGAYLGHQEALDSMVGSKTLPVVSKAYGNSYQLLVGSVPRPSTTAQPEA